MFFYKIDEASNKIPINPLFFIKIVTTDRLKKELIRLAGNSKGNCLEMLKK